MYDNMISVLVPIYNVEKYLKECIESILCQTYKNLEIILIDDGSTDDSGIICDEYARLDKRVRVIHKENGGVSSARNCGIENAVGEYIGFVDSDDSIAPDMYEKLYNSLVENDADISVCNVKKIDSDGNIIKLYKVPDGIFNQTEYFEMINESCMFAIPCNKLYKRDLFSGLYYLDGRIHEDEAIIHHLIGKTSKVSMMGEALYYYHYRPNSIMTSPLSIKKLDGAYAFFDRYKYLKNKGFDDYAYGAIINAAKVLYLCISKLSVKGNKQEIKKYYRLIMPLLKFSRLKLSIVILYRFKSFFRV